MFSHNTILQKTKNNLHMVILDFRAIGNVKGPVSAEQM